MNKKEKVFIGVVLILILYLQGRIISKIDRNYEDMISSDNFISERIDIITSNIHELRNIIKSQ